MDSNGYEKKRERARARAREKKHIDIGTVRLCAYVQLYTYVCIYIERENLKRGRGRKTFALPSDTLTH